LPIKSLAILVRGQFQSVLLDYKQHLHKLVIRRMNSLAKQMGSFSQSGRLLTAHLITILQVIDALNQILQVNAALSTSLQVCDALDHILALCTRTTSWQVNPRISHCSNSTNSLTDSIYRLLGPASPVSASINQLFWFASASCPQREQGHLQAFQSGHHNFLSIERRKLKEDQFYLQGDGPGIYAWQRINQLFNWLPLAALIENKIICMHGGIGRSIEKVEQIEALQRPLTMDAGTDRERVVLMDLLWSDPTENDSVEGLRPNARGPGLVTFGVSCRTCCKVQFR
jgi:diadenosine tetraphosphatase ApaH/serine/threonine PP2A family protein phosphatase